MYFIVEINSVFQELDKEPILFLAARMVQLLQIVMTNIVLASAYFQKKAGHL